MLLLLHVLMLSLLSGGSVKVVQNFESGCGQLFANGKSPTRFPGPQYRQICQTLNNDVYYATFYDTDNKIPVYSPAYPANGGHTVFYATFTLTNAAPQGKCFNRILWWDEEQLLGTHLKTACSSQRVYIVTGVVPGTHSINNRVNVPSHFWTAFCCLDNN
ncbi:endonuclease domain-containing 1 protein-like [Sinocyclocheilus grahami]|uniref:endonuclease domain-containing 1 protein-like n=1 Tax=Sinocyclocheilus grahami TaxID=75366 RepID=UPI0007ACF0F1|nr:PREDICTED: endonuclease domain-containing 1 protein-like [Sinocyclocheilus grahami]